MKERLNKNFLFMDIETVGQEADFKTFNEKNPSLGKEFIEYLPKIAIKFNEELNEDYIYEKYSGLYAEFGKIVVASFAFLDKKGEVRQESHFGEEKDILLKIASLLEKVDDLGFWLCGHNIRHFDIPFIAKRMIMNDIQPPSILPVMNYKPWELRIVDTRDFWQMGNNSAFSTLSLLCSSLGVASPKEDGMVGAEVHNSFWKEGKLNEVVKYCEGDVLALIAIIDKLKALK